MIANIVLFSCSIMAARIAWFIMSVEKFKLAIYDQRSPSKYNELNYALALRVSIPSGTTPT